MEKLLFKIFDKVKNKFIDGSDLNFDKWIIKETNLVYSDIDGFYVGEYGSVLLADWCGNDMPVEVGKRFCIIWGTSYRDKNGKQIFDGDIIKDKEGRIGLAFGHLIVYENEETKELISMIIEIKSIDKKTKIPSDIIVDVEILGHIFTERDKYPQLLNIAKECFKIYQGGENYFEEYKEVKKW